MVNTNQIAEIAALVGEPARASILGALMDGRALTAAELAGVAGITPQTASSHLARLTAARLLKVEKQGRHRYHRLASPAVARMLEGIMQIASGNAADTRRKLVVGPRDAALRRARTCYDHFAGRLGVAITDGLVARGVIEFGDDAGLVTEQGLDVLRRIGIDLAGGGRPRSSRPLCRPCFDWSERRSHVAGKLGAAIAAHYLEKGYVRRIRDSRALDVTPRGRKALRDMFGVTEPV
ncbi:MAG: helix-turn-helix transcriptional regulator [Kiloniellales bacterium]|nr:helix-turn-helix transcriptional regulator [Kiloniellales bacterium]